MICLICDKEFNAITNTHLKQHNLTAEEYKQRFNVSCLKNKETIDKYVNTVKGLTYEERYGVELAQKMKKIRSEKAKKQMLSREQLEIRKQKCGIYKNPEERKLNIKLGITSETSIKRRKTMFERYGTINTLNINGRFSKSAFIFIKKFCNENGIDEKMCYFKNGGINGKEYYQVLEINGIKRFCSYDFVCLDEDGSIKLILEYHGPYHFTKQQVDLDPDGKCVYFQPQSLTKKESFDRDCAKISHALKISKKVGVFWISKKTIIYYNDLDEYTRQE
jgi:hypothetical protein